MSFFLRGIGKYLPKTIMTNEDWAKYVETSDEWITARTGIKRRRFAQADESTATLALAAAKNALANANLTAQQIDEIIVATDTPEYRTPDTAAFLQRDLEAREIPTFDLCGSGCAGFLQAVDVATSRLNKHRKNILVVGVEVSSRFMDWTDRDICVLFGDGAAAFVVSNEEGFAQIQDMHSGTDGTQIDILAIKVGGTKYPFRVDMADDKIHKKLTMEGKAVFKEAVSRMIQSSTQLLERNGLKMDQIALMIPHQANKRIIDAIADRCNLPEQKVFTNLEEYGNTGSASVPIALTEAIEQKRINQGDRVLLTSFGAGLHWASALLYFTK